MQRCRIIFSFITLFLSFHLSAQQITKTDVLVIGGGVGGTAAAIQSARMGVKTILVEETNMLGGMLTTAGVSCTDGNNDLPSGIWEEFRQALRQHYQRKFLNTGWVSWTNFEPRVADSIFKSWVAKEKNLEVRYQQLCIQVIKKGNKVTEAVFTDIDQKISHIKSDIIVDGTELGDVMAKAGAGYDVGMDDPKESNEKEAKEKNDIIQDLTWVAILKDYGKDADKTIPKPANYDPKKYYCCCTDAPCNDKPWNGDKWKMINYGKLPRTPGALHDKYMLNWPAHGNDYYLNVIEKDYAGRQAAYRNAKDHTLGFIYFIQTELGLKQIGLADDELNNGMALIPYHREGRRLKGKLRFNINHIKMPYDYTLYRTGISVGDYPVDHHHAQYPGKVPALEFPHIPSYNIPLGTLIPQSVQGLIVCEKGISVTNLVNGTTRLQPVVMLTGQAAGVLAALSVLQNKQPAEVTVRDVQAELLKEKCFLMPFVDVKTTDPAWESIQKVGVTGILKGEGKSEGWSNKMFFYPDSTIRTLELSLGLSRYFGLSASMYRLKQQSSIEGLYKFLQGLRPKIKKSSFINVKSIDQFKDLWKQWGLENFEPNRALTRREASVVLDKTIILFGSKNFTLDINGNMNFKYSTF